MGVSSTAPAREGCVAAAGISCSYTATEPGSYAATTGPWTVKVIHPNGEMVPYGGNTGQFGSPIRPHDRVTAWADDKGTVRVGPTDFVAALRHGAAR